MSETWPVSEEGTLRIKQNAVFDLKQLYKLFHTFAEENKYIFRETNFTRKDRSDGSEYQIEYELERKVTSFIKFKMTIEIWSLRTTEIKQEGKTLYKGELEMNFDANMEMDYATKTWKSGKLEEKSNWETNSFTKFLRNIYIYYLRKQYFLNYAGKLWEELYELHAKTKALLHQFTFF